MARKRLTSYGDMGVWEEPEAATTRVKAVLVNGSRKLLTIGVDCRGKLPDHNYEGAIVRLNPTGLCTEDDIRWADESVRKKGAVAVLRLPLKPTNSLTGEETVQEMIQPEVSIRAVLVSELESSFVRDGLQEQERTEIITLAQNMLTKVGG